MCAGFGFLRLRPRNPSPNRMHYKAVMVALPAGFEVGLPLGGGVSGVPDAGHENGYIADSLLSEAAVIV